MLVHDCFLEGERKKREDGVCERERESERGVGGVSEGKGKSEENELKKETSHENNVDETNGRRKIRKGQGTNSEDGGLKLKTSDGVSVHILPGSIRLKLNLLILSGKDVVRIPKST